MKRWIKISFWTATVALASCSLLPVILITATQALVFEVGLFLFYAAYELKCFIDKPQYIKNEKAKLKAEAKKSKAA